MWKLKEQFKDITIITADRVTVDKLTITDQLVDNLLKLHSDHAEYFERTPNGESAPAGLKVKPQRNEG